MAEAAEAFAQITELCQQHLDAQAAHPPPAVADPKAKRQKSSTGMQAFVDHAPMNDAPTHSGTGIILSAELSNYWAATGMPSLNDDPAVWWQIHKESYPNVSALAHSRLADLWSAISVEQLNSAASAISGGRRAAMHAETLERHLLTRQNIRSIIADEMEHHGLEDYT
eukprot:371672_1